MPALVGLCRFRFRSLEAVEGPGPLWRKDLPTNHLTGHRKLPAAAWSKGRGQKKWTKGTKTVFCSGSLESFESMVLKKEFAIFCFVPRKLIAWSSCVFFCS